MAKVLLVNMPAGHPSKIRELLEAAGHEVVVKDATGVDAVIMPAEASRDGGRAKRVNGNALQVGHALGRLERAGLTPREIEVASLRALESFSIRETAEKTGLAEKTVKVHLTNACGKFGVRGVNELRRRLYPKAKP